MTSGKIKYQLDNLSLYGSIKATACGEQYPHLDPTGIAEIKRVAKVMSPDIDIVFYARSYQCHETAGIFNKPKLGLDTLLPLKFDLAKIIKTDEFEKLGSKAFDVLRQRYLKSFFKNQLLEDNQKISRIFDQLVDICPPNSTALVVSHAYLIKQLESYYLLGKNMFTDFSSLSKIFKPQFETMSRLQTVKIFIN